MDLQTILLAILSLFTAFYIGKLLLWFTFWQRHGVLCYPFISLSWYTKPFHLTMEEYGREYGRIYGLYDMSQRILVMNDARLARHISIKDLSTFAVRNSIYFGKSSVTRSLFFIPAQEDWKRIRSIVTPAFTSGKLRDMCQPIEAIVEKFVANLRREAGTGREFNIKRYCDSMAMDVIARCGYGIDIDSLSNPDHPVVVNARKILGVDATLSMIVCFMLPFLARLLKLEAFNWRATSYFDELTKTIVEKRIEAGGMKESKDLIGLMMQSSSDLIGETNDNTKVNKVDEDSKLKGITMKEISAQSIIFFIAGYDTTNTTFAHIFYYLTKHREWQENLYEEIKANENKLDYEHLKNLPVLNAIINETLRLNPPLMFFQRESIKDTYIGDSGIFVSKGTLISIQPYMVHRDPEYFPDPLVFKPERFIEDSAENSPAYMPFGVGPRLCVGMRFALNELRIALANSILNFRFEENKSLELEYFNGSILQSPKEVRVKIWERS